LLGSGGTETVETSAATISLFVNSPQLPSDNSGQSTAILTALVLNADGTVLEDIPVSFSKPPSDPSFISVTDPLTGPSGAEARLSNGIGSPQNRTITVTASAPTSGSGTVSDTVDVVVFGTAIGITGPISLAQDDSGNYVAVLTDSNGIGVSFKLLDIVSAQGNTITATTLTTDPTGKVNFEVTATQGGMDTLTISGLGISTDYALDVSDDTFAFTAPALPAEIVLSSTAGVAVTVHWEIGGVNQVGLPVNFTATRGNLSSTADMLNPATTATTDGSGDATLYIASTNAGAANIAATIAGGTTTTRSVEFISVSPSKLTLQATRFTVPVNEQTEIVATVRDADFNFVKNQTVNFSIVNDITLGSVNPASAITGSDGKASAFYTAGTVSGPLNGVTIKAEVASAPLVADTVALTVARKELDLVIGTGNDLFEPTTASYAQEWNVFVTDSVGNAVQNKSVQVAIRSINFIKGHMVLFDGTAPWGRVDPIQICAEEDGSVDGIRNGILDPGEDINLSGQIEAGNVAVVAPVLDTAPADDPCSTAGGGGASAEVTTNAQGIARVCVFWPQDHSLWVDVQIEAQANVEGSEFSAQQVYLLPVLADDISKADGAPPNEVSPYGRSFDPDTLAPFDCTVPPPGLPFP